VRKKNLREKWRKVIMNLNPNTQPFLSQLYDALVEEFGQFFYWRPDMPEYCKEELTVIRHFLAENRLMYEVPISFVSVDGRFIFSAGILWKARIRKGEIIVEEQAPHAFWPVSLMDTSMPLEWRGRLGYLAQERWCRNVMGPLEAKELVKKARTCPFSPVPIGEGIISHALTFTDLIYSPYLSRLILAALVNPVRGA